MTRLRRKAKLPEPEVQNQENKAPIAADIKKGRKRKTLDSEDQKKVATQSGESVKLRTGRNGQNLKNNDDKNSRNNSKLVKPQKRGTLRDIFAPVNGPLLESSPGRLEQATTTERHQTTPNAATKVSSPAKKRSKLSLKAAKDGGKSGSVQKLLFDKAQDGQKNNNETEQEKEEKETLMEIIKPPCVAALHNLGNTCFLNSVLQVLRYTPGFKSSIADLAKEIKITQKEKSVVADITKDPLEKHEILTWRLITSLNDAFRKMQLVEERYKKGQTQYIATRPYDLLDTIEKLNPMFEGNYQQDAHELLRCLLAYIQDASKELNSYRSRLRKDAAEDNKGPAETALKVEQETFEDTMDKETETKESENVKNDIPVKKSEINAMEKEAEIKEKNFTVKNDFTVVDNVIGDSKENESLETEIKANQTVKNDPGDCELMQSETEKMDTDSKTSMKSFFAADAGPFCENNGAENNMVLSEGNASECEVMLLSEESQGSIDDLAQTTTETIHSTEEGGDFKGNEGVKYPIHKVCLSLPGGGRDNTSKYSETKVKIDEETKVEVDWETKVKADGETKVKLSQSEFTPYGLVKTTNVTSPRENVFDKFETLVGAMTSQEQLDGAFDLEVKDAGGNSSNNNKRSRVRRKMRMSNKDNVIIEKSSRTRRSTRSRSNGSQKVGGSLMMNRLETAEDGNVSEKENMCEQNEEEGGETGQGQVNLKYIEAQTGAAKVVVDGKNVGLQDIASFFKKTSVVCLERCDPQGGLSATLTTIVPAAATACGRDTGKVVTSSSIQESTAVETKNIRHEDSSNCLPRKKKSSEIGVECPSAEKGGNAKEGLKHLLTGDQDKKNIEGGTTEPEVVVEKECSLGKKPTKVVYEEEKVQMRDNRSGEVKVTEAEKKHQLLHSELDSKATDILSTTTAVPAGSSKKEHSIKMTTPSKCRRVGLPRHRFAQPRLHLSKAVKNNKIHFENDLERMKEERDTIEGAVNVKVAGETEDDNKVILTCEMDVNPTDIQPKSDDCKSPATKKPSEDSSEKVENNNSHKKETDEGKTKVAEETAEIASPTTTLKNEARNKKSVVRIKKCSISSFFRRPPQRLEDVPRMTDSVCDCVETLFQGHMALRTKCLVCERYTERKEAYQDISVPVKKEKVKNSQSTSSLSDDEDEDSSDPSSWIFSSLAEVECLRDDNKYFCDNCLRLSEAQRSMHYVTTPDLLTLHLKRFAALSGYYGGFTKISDYVPTPLILPCIQDNCRLQCQDKSHRYELYGVVTHTGFSISAGHYVAYVKAPPGTKLELDQPATSPAKTQGEEQQNGNFHSNGNSQNPSTTGGHGRDSRDFPGEWASVSGSKMNNDIKLESHSEDRKSNSSPTSNKHKESMDNETDAAENSAVHESSAVWYECDDEIVTEMSHSSFEEILSPGSASTPYMLFYRRVGLVNSLV